MAHYFIEAARFDAKQRITHVRWGVVGQGNRWLTGPEVVDVAQVVNILHRDDLVQVRYSQGGAGAFVKRAVDGQREFIVDVEPENSPGGTLADLPPC